MITPEKIWLIDTGGEITWCDDPDPTGTIDPADVCEYTKTAPVSPSNSSGLLCRALADIEAELTDARMLACKATSQLEYEKAMAQIAAYEKAFKHIKYHAA